MANEGSHALLTGPIQGLITLPDGTTVDASPSVIYLDTHEDALAAAHEIGKHYEANGHPDDIEVDEETGQLVQREFVYDPEVVTEDSATQKAAVKASAKKSSSSSTSTPSTPEKD